MIAFLIKRHISVLSKKVVPLKLFYLNEFQLSLNCFFVPNVRVNNAIVALGVSKNKASSSFSRYFRTSSSSNCSTVFLSSFT